MAATNDNGQFQFWLNGQPFLGIQKSGNDGGEIGFWGNGQPYNFLFTSGVTNISGATAGTSTVTGVLSGTANISSTAAGTSTVTGTITGGTFLSGISAGTSTASGVLIGTADIAGSSAGTSTVIGTLYLILPYYPMDCSKPTVVYNKQSTPVNTIIESQNACNTSIYELPV